MKITAMEFKEKVTEILKNICKYSEEVVITSKGKPIAVLKPYIKSKKQEVFGCMKGSVKISGDILDLVNEPWDAEQ